MKVKSSCSDIRQSLTLLSWVHFFLIRQHQKTLLLLYRGHIALRALVAELLLLLVVGGCIGFCWPNGWCWKLSSRNGRREMQRKIALPPSFAFFFVATMLSTPTKKRTFRTRTFHSTVCTHYFFALRIWNQKLFFSYSNFLFSDLNGTQ